MPFTTVFALSPTFIIEANHYNRDVIVNLYSLSNTGAVIRCWDLNNATNDGQLTYVALGKQQWGYYEAKQNTYTLTFPISFNQRALSMCLSNSNNGKGKAVIWELGKESASIGNETWENYWIAVGVQQWGYCESTSTVQKHSFVLPFAKECWNCSVIPWKTPSSGYCSVAYTVSKAEFESYYYQATRTVSNCYIAIGVQQWGYVSHNNVRSDTPKVAVFPISFTKTIYTISTQLHMTNVRSDVGTGPYIVSYSNNQMSIIFNIEHSGLIMNGAWWLVIGK